MREEFKIPILLYHRLRRENEIVNAGLEDAPYLVSDREFADQMKYLFQQQVRTITVAELPKRQKRNTEREGFPGPKAIITFDDGHSSIYSLALPILRQYHFTATVFVTTDWINQPGWLSWTEIKELDDYGVEIGSHGRSHVALSRLNPSEIETELRCSKEMLEKKLGRKIVSLSIPGGFYSKEVKKIARSIGYQSVCTSEWGVNYPKIDFLSLQRLGIKNGLVFQDFVRLVEMEPSLISFYRLNYSVRTGLKRIIGLSAYSKLKKVMHRLRSK